MKVHTIKGGIDQIPTTMKHVKHKYSILYNYLWTTFFEPSEDA
jgi:hypothetical protein